MSIFISIIIATNDSERYLRRCLDSIQAQKNKENISSSLFLEYLFQLRTEPGDSPSNCAITGLLLGAYMGYSNIPVDMINNIPVEHRELLNNKINKYFSFLNIT